jgi:hypothetical protein
MAVCGLILALALAACQPVGVIRWCAAVGPANVADYVVKACAR